MRELASLVPHPQVDFFHIWSIYIINEPIFKIFQNRIRLGVGMIIFLQIVIQVIQVMICFSLNKEWFDHNQSTVN